MHPDSPPPAALRADPPPTPAARVRDLLPLALPPALLLPFLAWFFWRVKLPFWDQFSMTFLFEKYYSHQLTVADLTAPFNGHRVPLQRLVSLGLGILTHWHVGIEALVSNVLNGAIFVLIVRELRRSLGGAGRVAPPALLLFLSVLFFSLNQYENWFNGWMLQLLFSELCTVGALLLLCREELSLRGVAGATLLAVAASFSFGSGLATWPVGFLALLLHPMRRRMAALAVWVLAALATAIVYTHGSPPESPHNLADLRHAPGYLASYLGCPVFSINGLRAVFLGPTLQGALALVAPAVGVCGVLVAVLAYRHVRRLGVRGREIQFPLMLCLFALVSGGLIAVARVGQGSVQAMSPHYISVSRLLWVGIAMLYGRSALASPRPVWVRATGVLVALMLLASYANGFKNLREWRQTQLAVQARLLTRYDDETLGMITGAFPPARLHEGIETLKRHRLALFAGPAGEGGAGEYVPPPRPEAAPAGPAGDLSPR